MNVSPSKENILKKIRKALTQSTPVPFPQSEGSNSVFQAATQEAEVEFAEQFTKLQGRFVFCVDKAELQEQLAGLVQTHNWQKIYCRETPLLDLAGPAVASKANTSDLASCDVSVTGCEYLVARTGSIVMSAGQQSGRTTSVYAPIHICIAFTNQLVYDVREALQGIKEKYENGLPSQITFATGPSRTADIEKTLVVGVHGPKEVYVFLVEQE